MSAIIDVEGIGPVYAEKLKDAGIVTTGALLKEGATPAGRKKIEKDTGIAHKLILRWTNHVDLVSDQRGSEAVCRTARGRRCRLRRRARPARPDALAAQDGRHQ